jgi:hypothetical protein
MVALSCKPLQPWADWPIGNSLPSCALCAWALPCSCPVVRCALFGVSGDMSKKADGQQGKASTPCAR